MALARVMSATQTEPPISNKWVTTKVREQRIKQVAIAVASVTKRGVPKYQSVPDFIGQAIDALLDKELPETRDVKQKERA